MEEIGNFFFTCHRHGYFLRLFFLLLLYSFCIYNKSIVLIRLKTMTFNWLFCIKTVSILIVLLPSAVSQDLQTLIYLSSAHKHYYSPFAIRNFPLSISSSLYHKHFTHPLDPLIYKKSLKSVWLFLFVIFLIVNGPKRCANCYT